MGLTGPTGLFDGGMVHVQTPVGDSLATNVSPHVGSALNMPEEIAFFPLNQSLLTVTALISLLE